MNDQGRPFRKFILLWSGELISAIGSGITSFGLGVYAYSQTGKASAVSLVMLLAFLPSLLLSAIAGVLADRYDRRLLMIIGDSLSALGIGFILICMFRGQAELWQICVGVTISSVFSSLLEPSYRASVTDLLSQEQYTRASGLVQLAGSAKYLISPIIAGLLLAVSDIKLLLIIDISTFLVTVFSTLVVRKGLVFRQRETKPFLKDFKEGWIALSQNKGILALMLVASVITLFLGFIQTLSTPLIMAFSNSSVLGTIMTISAGGMLISSLIIGMIAIKKNHVKMLSLSLFFAGIFMAGFGLRENIILIGISGFLFFAMLPFANTSLDYLTRTNIRNSEQGRVWGFIGLISQLGYVLAYAFSGALADYVFDPMLRDNGLLAANVGRIIGAGRGSALLIILSGLLLSVSAIVLYRIKSIKNLETGGDTCISKSSEMILQKVN